LGLLGPRTLLIHAQHLRGDDEARIARALVPVVVCPGTIEWFGRPSPPVPELLANGATDREIATALGVAESTLHYWRAQHLEFSEALKVGKAPCDDRVEASLYHRATGYTFESEKIFNYQGEVVRAKIIEHVPPETTAAIFWLKNRRKETWRDKQEIDHTIDLSNMTDEQLADIASGRSNGVIKAPKDKTISH
jgi:hypothetical protein